MILDGHPMTIVGITPPGFFGETLRSDPPEVWIPSSRNQSSGSELSAEHKFPRGCESSDG